MLNSYQGSLPKLPVPGLTDTLARVGHFVCHHLHCRSCVSAVGTRISTVTESADGAGVGFPSVNLKGLLQNGVVMRVCWEGLSTHFVCAGWVKWYQSSVVVKIPIMKTAVLRV